MEAVKPGFKPLARTNIRLGAGQTITVDLRMEPDENPETIPIEARCETSTVLGVACGNGLLAIWDALAF